MTEKKCKITLGFRGYASSPQQRTAAYKFILDAHNYSQNHGCDFYELVIIRRGDGNFHYGENVFPVVRNEVYLIPPHTPHFYSDYTNISMLHFIFLPEILEPYRERFLQEQNFLHLSSVPDAEKALAISDDLMQELERINFCIAKESIDKMKGYVLRQEFLVLQVLSLICSCSEFKARRELKSGSELYAAILFIENNYASAITLKKLAKCANMSVPGFCRMFKKEQQISPIRYLLKYRIEMSKQLLISTRLSLTEIAQRTGFNDTNYFIRQFGAISGMSPMKFRNQEHGLLHYPSGITESMQKVAARIFAN